MTLIYSNIIKYSIYSMNHHKIWVLRLGRCDKSMVATTCPAQYSSSSCAYWFHSCSSHVQKAWPWLLSTSELTTQTVTHKAWHDLWWIMTHLIRLSLFVLCHMYDHTISHHTISWQQFAYWGETVACFCKPMRRSVILFATCGTSGSLSWWRALGLKTRRSS